MMTLTDGLIVLMIMLTWVAALLDRSDRDRMAYLIVLSVGVVELYNALMSDRDGRWGAFVLCLGMTGAVVTSVKRRRLQREEAGRIGSS